MKFRYKIVERKIESNGCGGEREIALFTLQVSQDDKTYENIPVVDESGKMINVFLKFKSE